MWQYHTNFLRATVASSSFDKVIDRSPFKLKYLYFMVKHVMELSKILQFKCFFFLYLLSPSMQSNMGGIKTIFHPKVYLAQPGHCCCSCSDLSTGLSSIPNTPTLAINLSVSSWSSVLLWAIRSMSWANLSLHIVLTLIDIRVCCCISVSCILSPSETGWIILIIESNLVLHKRYTERINLACYSSIQQCSCILE